MKLHVLLFTEFSAHLFPSWPQTRESLYWEVDSHAQCHRDALKQNRLRQVSWCWASQYCHPFNHWLLRPIGQALNFHSLKNVGPFKPLHWSVTGALPQLIAIHYTSFIPFLPHWFYQSFFLNRQNTLLSHLTDLNFLTLSILKVALRLIVQLQVNHDTGV